MMSFKKQLLTLALIAGIIAPASAMDTNPDSSGWLGWKAAAGVTAVIGVATCAVVYKWLKAPKAELKVSDFVPLEDNSLETKEDIHVALVSVDQQLAALENELAQYKTAVAPKPAQPAKRVQGQSHGVTNQVLTATKLKKTGVNTTPAKK